LFTGENTDQLTATHAVSSRGWLPSRCYWVDLNTRQQDSATPVTGL